MKIRRRQPFYLGWLAILVGVFFKRLVELTLSADAQIEAPRYLALIAFVQVVLIAAGAVLVLRQPAIWLPRKAEFILILSSLTLTFLALELVARVWLNYFATPAQHDRYVLFTSLKPEDLAWKPHPYLAYAPNPNYHKGRTAHNSLGYRNDEFPLEKPSGVFRIVALGGSSTYDVAIEDNALIFTAQLEATLKEDYGYDQVQVINAGVPGYNSWEMLVNLEFRVLDLDPDLVIIYEGTNDVHARLVEPAAYRGDDTGRRQAWQTPPVAIWEHSALLRIMSRALNLTRQVSVDDFVSPATYMSWPYEYRMDEADLNPADVLAENPPRYFQRNLENMIAVAQEHDITILFSTWAYSPNLNDYASRADYQQGFRENNEVVREVATRHHIPLFDFAAVMPQAAEYWADGRHVNEQGALEKARLFAAYLDAEGLIQP